MNSNVEYDINNIFSNIDNYNLLYSLLKNNNLHSKQYKQTDDKKEILLNIFNIELNFYATMRYYFINQYIILSITDTFNIKIIKLIEINKNKIISICYGYVSPYTLSFKHHYIHPDNTPNIPDYGDKKCYLLTHLGNPYKYYFENIIKNEKYDYCYKTSKLNENIHLYNINAIIFKHRLLLLILHCKRKYKYKQILPSELFEYIYNMYLSTPLLCY